MSVWHNPKKEDIELSEDGKTLEIYLFSDYGGAVYAEIQVEDVREILKREE